MSRLTVTRDGISVTGVRLRNGRTVDVKPDGIYENGQCIVARRMPTSNINITPAGIYVAGECWLDGTQQQEYDAVLCGSVILSSGANIQIRHSGVYGVHSGYCYRKFDTAPGSIFFDGDVLFVDDNTGLDLVALVDETERTQTAQRQQQQHSCSKETCTQISAESWQATALTSTDSENVSCQICEENRRDVAFVPCGHANFCIDCTRKLPRDTHMVQCPVCKAAIAEICRMKL